MEKLIINIDSRFRNKDIYLNSGKFTIKLDIPIKNVQNIKLSSFEFPNFYFSSNKNNTSFTITGYPTIIINNGFYSSAQIIEAIQNQFNIYSLNFLINIKNNKVIISSTIIGTSFNIDFSNSSIYPSLGKYLGFINNNYISNNNIIESDININVFGDKYIFLKINDYGQIYSVINKKNLQLNSYLAKIILGEYKLENNFDNNNFITKEFIFRQPTNINKFDIELLDCYNNTINMINYMDYSLTLELSYIYDNKLNSTYDGLVIH